MKFAADFRRIAREALSGKWSTAVIAGIISMLLGGIDGGGIGFNFVINDDRGVNITFGNKEIINSEQFSEFFAIGMIYIIAIAIVAAILFLIIGSIISVGYAKFNLNLVDKNYVSVNMILSYTTDWKRCTACRLIKFIRIFLLCMLFVIPGIIAHYSYSMAEYILSENSDISPKEALRRSSDMMRGNRIRLFSLEISFIGWSILAALTMGIGNIFLVPYMQAAYAAFYREVSSTEFFGVEFPKVEL